MKWAVGVLCLLGVVAASCAALLVNSLRATSNNIAFHEAAAATQPTDVDVLVATKAIPAMTVIDSSVVTVKSMSASMAPRRYLSNPVDVVGKVLATPVVEGQPFTPVCFSDDGGAQQVAAVIPQGKRAVGIQVTDFAGLDGLLYPGCVVDVLVSFKSDSGGDQPHAEESVATTLLEAIQVLAIEQQTVISPGRTLGDDVGHGSSRRVTLLVDPKQARALELGMQAGILSLALRNPMDRSAADRDMTSLESLLGEGPIATASTLAMDGNPMSTGLTQMFANFQTDHPKSDGPKVVMKVNPTQATGDDEHWDITIIHGEVEEVKSVAMPVTVTKK